MKFKSPRIEKEFNESITTDLRNLLVDIDNYYNDSSILVITQLIRTEAEQIEIYSAYAKKQGLTAQGARAYAMARKTHHFEGAAADLRTKHLKRTDLLQFIDVVKHCIEAYALAFCLKKEFLVHDVTGPHIHIAVFK